MTQWMMHARMHVPIQIKSKDSKRCHAEEVAVQMLQFR